MSWRVIFRNFWEDKFSKHLQVEGTLEGFRLGWLVWIPGLAQQPGSTRCSEKMQITGVDRCIDKYIIYIYLIVILYRF